ncbi:hypothetical protein HA402_013161 [Bradysia odoriphaga]|nr:hypothetical protein HA402_013161 [Bradysia odoriphaga]
MQLSLLLADDLFCAEYKNSLFTYHPIRHCQRSNKTVIGLSNVKTVDRCAEFAVQRRAMAFNFAPVDRGHTNLFEKAKENILRDNHTKYYLKDVEEPEEFFNCELLACPEFRNFSHIVNDSRFDYYSLYAKFLPPNNATCLPTVGVFQYHNEFANYSMATQKCLNGNGSLAHILSETRTNSLSNFIYRQQNVTTRVKVAYVGLNETVRNKFRTSADEPIECSLYRAWAPGHPMQKNILRCVALTDDDSWQTFSCLKRLPFICEIHMSGASDDRIDFKRKCSTKEKQ